jgi:hypothetical protein
MRVTLPAPLPAAQAAVRAETWFQTHRLSIDVFHAHERRFEGACLHHWFLRPHGRGRARRWRGLRHGSLLLLSHGPVVLASEKRHVVLAEGRRLPGLPNFLAAAVGCTGTLDMALTTAAQEGGHLSMERAYAANRPALALELSLHREELTVYVSPLSYQPLVVIGDIGGRTAAARLYLGRVTPTLAATFRRRFKQNGIPIPR